jgi:hypothetical protein
LNLDDSKRNLQPLIVENKAKKQDTSATPAVSMSSHNPTASAVLTLSTSLQADYYNELLMAWEPAVESWSFRVVASTGTAAIRIFGVVFSR